MLFQIVSKRSGVVLADKLTLNQVAKKIYCYFQELDEYALEAVLFAEKEFLIRTQNSRNQNFVKKNEKDFKVIVRRIQ